jgi:hypothetical protein
VSEGKKGGRVHENKIMKGLPSSEIGILLFLHQLLNFFDHVELLTAKHYFSLSFNL